MALVFTQQLPEHKRQDPSVPVVVHLDGRIDAQLHRLIDDGAVLARDVQSDILLRLDLIAEAKHVVDFRAVELRASVRADAFRELQRQHAHAHEVGAVDALEALRDDGLHAEQAGALGGPVAARAGAVFLAGEDDERGARRPGRSWRRRR